MTRREALARALTWRNFDDMNDNTKKLHLDDADRLLKAINVDGLSEIWTESTTGK